MQFPAETETTILSLKDSERQTFPRQWVEQTSLSLSHWQPYRLTVTGICVYFNVRYSDWAEILFFVQHLCMWELLKCSVFLSAYKRKAKSSDDETAYNIYQTVYFLSAHILSHNKVQKICMHRIRLLPA